MLAQRRKKNPFFSKELSYIRMYSTVSASAYVVTSIKLKT